MIEKTHDSDDDDGDGFAVPTSRTAASMRNPRMKKGSLTALDNVVKRNMEQRIIENDEPTKQDEGNGWWWYCVIDSDLRAATKPATLRYVEIEGDAQNYVDLWFETNMGKARAHRALFGCNTKKHDRTGLQQFGGVAVIAVDVTTKHTS